MVPSDPWTGGAGAVVALAVLQLVLARWRDLGPLALAASAILVVLALPAPPLAVWVGVSVAALVSASAQARGASRGIGHPSLASVVLGCGIAIAAGVEAVSGAAVGSVSGGASTVRIVGAVAIGIVGLVATAVALRAPGARHRPVRWVGEIPIVVPTPQVPPPSP